MNAWLCSDNRGESGDHLAVRTFKFGPLLSTSFKILYTKIVLRYSHFPINICNTPCKSLQDQPNQNMYLRTSPRTHRRRLGLEASRSWLLSPSPLPAYHRPEGWGWSLIHLFNAFWRFASAIAFLFHSHMALTLITIQKKIKIHKNTHLRATCWRDEHVINPKSKVALPLVPRLYC